MEERKRKKKEDLTNVAPHPRPLSEKERGA